MIETLVTTTKSEKRRHRFGFLILIFILTIFSVIYLCYESLFSPKPRVGKYFQTENSYVEYVEKFNCIINIKYEGEKEWETSLSISYDDAQDKRENCIPL